MKNADGFPFREAQMLTNTRPNLHFSHIICTALLTCAGACHTDVAIEDSASATDAQGLFTAGASDASSEGFTPTTSDGADTDGNPVNPLKFCEMHPDASYDGVAFSCTGTASGALSFDYYGDPDLKLNTMLPCIDRSDLVKKDPGYVYTCFVGLNDEAFGPDIEQPNGRHIGACCVENSPEEAVFDFCTIGAAEESCRSLSDGLNELRMQLPKIPKLSELNDQLLRLNQFFAESGSQTACASTIAKELLADSLDQNGNLAVWHPESKVQEDPDEGWRWFRSISLRMTEFSLTEVEETGESCQDSEFTELLDGHLDDGTLDVSGVGLRGASRVIDGTFALATSACATGVCPVRLDALRVSLQNLDLGPYHFTDLEAHLMTPVAGEKRDDQIVLVGQRLELAVSGRLVSAEGIRVDGDRMTVRVRAMDAVNITAAPDGSFAITKLQVTAWPFETNLTAHGSTRD